MEENLNNREGLPHRWFFSRLGWAINFVLLFGFFGQIFVQQLATRWAPQLLEKFWFVWLAAVVVTYGIAFPLGALLLRTVPTPPKQTGKPLSGAEFIKIYVALLAGLYMANVATLALMTVLGERLGTEFFNPAASAMDQPLWSNVLLACVFAPLAEEFLFRKMLLSRLRPYGDGFAILVSALAFALVHGNLYQFFYALVAGVMLGYVAVRTGSIRQTILLHALANFVGAGVLPLALLLGDVAVNLMGMAVMFVMGMGVFFALRLVRTVKLAGSQYPLEWAEKWQYLLVNPGFTVLTLSFIASAIFYLTI